MALFSLDMSSYSVMHNIRMVMCAKATVAHFALLSTSIGSNDEVSEFNYNKSLPLREDYTINLTLL